MVNLGRPQSSGFNTTGVMKKFIVGFLPHQQPGSPANTHRQGRGRQTLFWLIILGVVFLGWGCAVGSPMDQARRQAIKKMNDDARDRSAQEAEHFAFVHGQYVSSPKGKLLLIRRGPDLCAVRVTSYRRGHDASPRTFFYTGDEPPMPSMTGSFKGMAAGILPSRMCRPVETNSLEEALWGSPSIFLGN